VQIAIAFTIPPLEGSELTFGAEQGYNTHLLAVWSLFVLTKLKTYNSSCPFFPSTSSVSGLSENKGATVFIGV
jgi:hypothetical protein